MVLCHYFLLLLPHHKHNRHDMKLLRILPFIMLFAVFTACEKAVIDDEDDNDKTENPIEKPDNPGTDNEDDNSGNDGSDNSGEDSDGDDTVVDPGNDSDKNQEETDINNGNEEKGDGEIGTGDIVSVNDFINKSIKGGVYVKGYIVGSCHDNIKYADFKAPFTGASALLLADDPEETSIDKVIAIQLKSGSSFRKVVNLKDHPENKGKQLKVFGYRSTYLGIIGMKDIANGMFELYD